MVMWCEVRELNGCGGGLLVGWIAFELYLVEIGVVIEFFEFVCFV